MRVSRPMLMITLLLAALGADVASAQSLQERIQHYKKQKARRDADNAVRHKVRVLQVLLYRDMDLDYEQTPVRAVFEDLAERLEINIVGRYIDDRIPHGILPEQPITLKLKQIPVITALELILEQCSDVEPCTWQIREGFLEVGTKERLAAGSARELRVYPIADLLYEAPHFDDAPELGIILPEHGYPAGGGFGGSIRISTPSGGSASRDPGLQVVELILETIEPEGWTQNGGNWGSVRFSQGSLIVDAPDFMQRQIGGYPRVPPPRTPPGGDAARDDQPRSKPKPVGPARRAGK